LRKNKTDAEKHSLYHLHDQADEDFSFIGSVLPRR
jgi:hypothetical protein